MKRVVPLLLLVPLLILGCGPGAEVDEQPAEEAAAPAPDPSTPEGKIAEATAAAPAAIGAGAMVMDWPATPEGAMTELRPGTNGYTCMPNVPTTPGPDPMCFDSHWMEWASGWMSKSQPKVTGVGVAYMLQGGSDASNTDPFATGPAPGEGWVETGPHVMVVVPDPKALDGMNTDYTSGAPYVMWQGTPYAHIMVPIR
jgi:hypothetical protein